MSWVAQPESMIVVHPDPSWRGRMNCLGLSVDFRLIVLDAFGREWNNCSQEPAQSICLTIALQQRGEIGNTPTRTQLQLVQAVPSLLSPLSLSLSLFLSLSLSLSLSRSLSLSLSLSRSLSLSLSLSLSFCVYIPTHTYTHIRAWILFLYLSILWIIHT